MLVKNDLFDYDDRYIYQDSDFFKFSVDSILLAEFVNLNNVKSILDMCAGNMAIPLILSKYTDAHIVGFEIQENVYNLGKESIILNGLSDRLEIINDDINNIGDYYNAETFDVIVCNPPFFKAKSDSYINKIEQKALARHEISLKLDDIFKLARTYLKNKGSLYIVHRAERLDDLMVVARENNINIKNIQLISTKKFDNPKIVLIKAVKNSNPGVKINKEICISDVTTYKNIFKEEL